MNCPEDLYLDLLKRTLTASDYDESYWRVIEGSGKEIRVRHPIRSLKAFARQMILIARAVFGGSLMLVDRRRPDPAAREEGMDWPCFGYSMAGHKAIDNVRFCVEDVIRNGVPGDFIETGVWRGGMVIYMRALLKVYGVTDRVVWLADSFEGLPAPKSSSDGIDLSYVSYLKVSLEDVETNFRRFGLLDGQVRFLKGWFCDTLPEAPVERLAILRLDGDMYSSTMDALTGLYHKVSPGGYVIVDDYFSWDSCRAAVTDFLASRNIQVDLQRVDGSRVFWQVTGDHPQPI